MRATSLPTALPIATAAVALVAAVLAPLAVPCSALAKRWLRPVSGEVARSFSYARAAPFVRGAHRGVDLAAPPGTAVRAACAGRVVHAGPVPGSDEVVSMRCGARRVSYLPLATVAVRAGATIKARTALGTVAPGHGGLHVGVRRAGDPFGYEDPMPLLTPNPARPRGAFPTTRAPRSTRPRAAPARPQEPPMLPRPLPLKAPSLRTAPSSLPAAHSPPLNAPSVRAARSSPPALHSPPLNAPSVRPARSSPPALHSPPLNAPSVRPARSSPPAPHPLPSNAPPPHRAPSSPPAAHPAPLHLTTPRPRRSSPRLAPWPVWAGLALVLAGAAGTGTVALRRRRARTAPAARRLEAPA